MKFLKPKSKKKNTFHFSVTDKQLLHRKGAPYLGGDPVFAFGCGVLVHTLCPGRDVACTVISITLEHQLTHTLAAGLEGTKSHAVSQAVQHLSVKQRVQINQRVIGRFHV